MPKLNSLGVMLMSAVVMLAMTAGVASASTGGPRPGLMVPPGSIGLTNNQAQQAQRQVNAFISRYGGTQVAINMVSFKGGSILFAVQGRNASQVANASAGRTVQPADSWTSCPLGYFCEWNGLNYGGNSKSEYYYCQILDKEPYKVSGSWKNDQTPQNGTGPRVKFYWFIGGSTETPPPWSASTDFEWANIKDFVIC